jgi:HEAT repeat protein
MIRRARPLVIAVAFLAAVVLLLYSRWTFELIRGLRISAALEKVGPAEAAQVPVLIARLRDSNPMIRQAAAGALGRIGPVAAAARPALLGCLGDASSQVRSNAAWALGLIGSATEVIPPLTRALDDEDPEVRRYAAFGLSCLGPIAAPAVPKLIERLDDAHMSYMAARALGGVGPAATHSIPRLILALRRDHSLARMEFAAALGKFGTLARDAIPDLRALAHDPDPNVKRAAGAALLRIQPEWSVP